MERKQNFQWGKLELGTCYYPEHWDKSLWESDLDRMLAHGITTIRIAEFAWSLVDIFWSAAYVIGSMAVMLAINWQLALLVIAVVPVIALLTLYFQKRILRINRQARRINAEITRHYNEGISGAKTSKTLVIEDKNTAAFQEVTSRMRETTVRAVLLNAVYVPIIGFLTALAVAFVLTGGGNMVLWGSIGIGQLTIFVNFALGIADPVQTLARTISNFIATQANIERVSALLELQPGGRGVAWLADWLRALAE